MVQQHVGRAGRSHAQKRPDDARRRHGGLEHVGLEPLIEEIGRAHGHQLNLVVAVLIGQRAETPGHEQQPGQAARVQRHRIGRRHAQDRLDEARHLDHRPAVLVVRFGVELRVPGDFPPRFRVIVHAPQVIVRHRREGAIERQDLEAVPRQIEVADDLGPQQRHDVRAHRELEAGKHFLGDRGPPEHRASLEHEDLPARPGEICGGRETVVTAADHDGAVFH